MATMTNRNSAANRLGLDYAAEATRFAPLPYPIIDVHSHLGGQEAAKIYQRVAKLYGVGLTYSMTGPNSAEAVRRILGDAVRFIVIPEIQGKGLRHALTNGFVARIHKMRKHGARIVKFWAAPRGRDFGEAAGVPNALRLDAPYYRKAMQLTQDLGMTAMVHVADPDTWFATKYADAEKYGTKAEHYERLEFVLDQFSMPFIAAHCGGWPENLDFLDGMLDRHSNLNLDLSATKWMVRELSRHSTERIHAFLKRWKGRLMFGSDIVVKDAHLSAAEAENEMSSKAAGETEAFDLYASRYWALRTLFETGNAAESPIADPDLVMTDPDRYSEFDAPQLIGKSLPPDLLKSLYHDAAHELLEGLYQS